MILLKKSYIILISLIVIVVLLNFGSQFISINKDLFPLIDRDDRYPTAREALNKDSDADIIRVDNRIYFRNEDWQIITPSDPKDYNKGEVIGDIKKKTTNEWWFKNLYATKLEEGTTVYSDETEYRKGDAPFHILIEEDGDIVFYETLLKDEEDDDTE